MLPLRMYLTRFKILMCFLLGQISLKQLFVDAGNGGISTPVLIAVIVPIRVSALLFIIGFCFIRRKTKKKNDTTHEDSSKIERKILSSFVLTIYSACDRLTISLNLPFHLSSWEWNHNSTIIAIWLGYNSSCHKQLLWRKQNWWRRIWFCLQGKKFVTSNCSLILITQIK